MSKALFQLFPTPDRTIMTPHIARQMGTVERRFWRDVKYAFEIVQDAASGPDYSSIGERLGRVAARIAESEGAVSALALADIGVAFQSAQDERRRAQA